MSSEDYFHHKSSGKTNYSNLKKEKHIRKRTLYDRMSVDDNHTQAPTKTVDYYNGVAPTFFDPKTKKTIKMSKNQNSVDGDLKLNKLPQGKYYTIDWSKCDMIPKNKRTNAGINRGQAPGCSYCNYHNHNKIERMYTVRNYMMELKRKSEYDI
jgi:hypothetical protein